MKNFTNNFKQFTSRLSARWLVMALMMLVGTSSVIGAQKNLNWQGKVYFLVPEEWNLSTYSTVQVDITRTTTATESNYQFYAGKMTRIGTSRLFYLQLNADHSNWNQNEYIAFTANSSTYDSGKFNLNGNELYTTPLDYGCNNSNNYYLFKPSTESQFTTTTNGNTLTAGYNSSRDNVLKANQTVYIYTNGSSSTSGGSVSLTGYYLSSDDAMTPSTVNSSSTSAEYGAAPGSEMNLTAVANSGYEFEGWYTAASDGILLSSNTTYTYNVYETKKIYARFKQSCVNVEVPNITSDSPICLGSELTLTLKDRQDGVTYNIGNQEIFTGGNNTYSFTPQTTGSASLTVVASHEKACNGATNQIVIDYTVNARPSAPILTTGSTNVCSGSNLDLTSFAPNGTVWYEEQVCSTPLVSTTVSPQTNKTYYAKTKDGNCYSSQYSEFTINVTTTPVITANKLVTTIGSPITLTSNIDAIWTTTGGILNPNSEKTSSVEFTSQNNGRYIITASNTANEITCSASKEVSVQNAFYVYIRRPKSGDNVYDDWYGKTNDAEKGNAPWFKEGTPNYSSMEDTNYGGVGPVESFTDCNDYTWDAFEFAGGNFYIHAPNTGGSDGWATFTKETYIESLSGDVYYYISSFTGGQQGSVLSESATKPERAPEIITPVTSLNPASGILCSGSQATLTVTNPQNDYTYTLMYKGTAQGEPISGNNEVEFTVIEAGSYSVQAKVQSNSGCTSTASSSASQIKVIATDIKFDATEYTTTPWVPVTVVIEVPSGYEFTYNDATLTNITPEADKPIKKENGHEYTYTFPRPTGWGIGNSQSGDGYDEKPYTITATIKNAEQCGTATATVKLQDEGNDSCTLP